jgi:hypothetical protein
MMKNKEANMSIKFFPSHLSYRLDISKVSAADLKRHELYFSRIEISETLFSALQDYYSSRHFFWKVFESEHIDHCFNNIYYAVGFTLTKITKYKYKKKFYLDPLLNLTDFNRKIKMSYIKPTEAELARLDVLLMIGEEYYDIYHLLSAILRKYHNEIIDASIYQDQTLYKELTKHAYLDLVSPQYSREHYQKVRDAEIAEMLRKDKELENEPNNSNGCEHGR